MKALSVLALILSALQSTLVEATINWISRADQGTNLRKAQDGFAEAIRMAQKVVNDLEQSNALNDARIEGAFIPLFRPEHLQEVLRIFRKVTTVATDTDTQVTFYLNEDRLTYDPTYAGGLGAWLDPDFVDPSGNRILPGVPLDGGDAHDTPGHDETYTFLGYDDRGMGGEDFSKQMHTFLFSELFDNQDDLDKRPLDEIKRDGFANGQYMSSLSRIDAVSTEILHELIHSVGGRKLNSLNPDGTIKEIGQPVIGDGPNDDTYGWVECVRLRTSTTDGSIPIQLAESYAMLGQALYLDRVTNPSQAHNSDPNLRSFTCFWSTGYVDPTTGNAIVDPAAHVTRDLMFTKFNETNYVEQQHHHDYHTEHGNTDTFDGPSPFKHTDGPHTTAVLTRGLAGRLWVPV